MNTIKLSKIKLITLCTLGVLSQANAKVAGKVGAHMKGFVPGAEKEKTKLIRYVKLGQVAFETERHCGDGDVAHLSQKVPDLDFAAKDSKIDIVAGYWISGGVTSGTEATYMKWIPSGKITVPSGQSATELIEIGRAALGPRTAKGVLEATKTKLTNLSGFKLPSSPDNKFNVHLGAMACMNGNITDTTKSPDTMTALDIAQSIQNINRAQIDQAVNVVMATPTVDFNKIATLNVAMDTGFQLSTVLAPTGGIPITNDPLVKLGMSLVSTAHPCPTCVTPKQFTDQLKNVPAIKEAFNLAVQLGQAGNCHAGLSRVTVQAPSPNPVMARRFSSSQYWWEPFPLQLTCRQLIKPPSGMGITTAINSLFGVTAVPDANSFNVMMRNIASSIVKAGAIQVLQNALQTQPVIGGVDLRLTEQENCVRFMGKPDSALFIHKVISSLTVGGTIHAKSNIFTSTSHPESLFALKDYFKPYKVMGGPIGLGNISTIYNMGGDPVNSPFAIIQNIQHLLHMMQT